MTAEDCICRVCEREENLKYIFDGESTELAEKLIIVADVQVKLDDDLPKYICVTCSENLDFAYDFRIQCEYTDRKLRELVRFRKENTENTENEIAPASTEVIENFSEESPCFDVEPKVEEEEYLVEEYDDIEELIEEEVNLSNEEEGIVKDQIIVDPEQGDEYTLDYCNENLEHTKEEHEESKEKTEEIVEYNSPNNEEFLAESDQFSDEDPTFLIEVENPNENYHQSENGESSHSSDTNSKEEDKEWNETKSLKKAKKSSDKFFRCDTCGESFSTFSEFNQHKKTHGDRRYQCPVCKKWFSKRYRLKNHMTIHEEQKSFECEICGNKYTNQGNLDRHIRHYHKKERPYICTQCGLSFSRSNILKLHYTVHMNERNYECEICNKR